MVTVAALFGSGGSVVGPAVAERLGVPFFDRSIAQAVASRTGLSEKAVAELDDEASRQPTFWGRLSRLSTVTGEGGGSFERLDLSERDVRGHIEAVVAGTRKTGGVVLGRGGMVLLQDVPWALHVHLRGPADARARQGADILGIDPVSAEKQQKLEDRARRDYVSKVYGVDGEDPSFYHLVIDSTALDLDLCVELIVEAARARLKDHAGGDR
ncbi:cytidylate kinase [Knoellia sinensis KCTC 19936]|uniref:Cytidylate kinase n=1 Tax=Knoellia sinensis KCTC 19936 TaxID=1385520 RepID=A0A0A0J4J8_9MICO|nr:cytidylate kinase [Knoellia sinensis KCTC 19936]